MDTSIGASRESTDNVEFIYSFRPIRGDSAEIIARKNAILSRDLNPFGDGSLASGLSAEEFDLFRTNILPNSPKVTLYSFRSVADGGLFDMSGGEARLAVGLEYRLTEVDYSSDPQRSQLVTDFGAGAFAENASQLQNLTLKPKEGVASLFSELSLPIVNSDNRLPGIEALTVNLAARTERYDLPDARSGSGASYNHTSPRLGLNWQITEDVTLQANWGESYQAPTARQITASSVVFRTRINDPLAPAGTPSFPIIDFIVGGNANIRPETSETTNIG
ncbi:MAG: TonB-dependent receptor, partial [Porticoccaceae bacterium]|nr:TonB-dependent receptor [Porticoccaceae bacterium]